MTLSDRACALTMVPSLGELAGVLEIYERLLLKWQGKLNLVGRSTLSEVWTRHFADSAQLATEADLARRWVDLGSGAGFPGMVLALIQRKRVAGEMHLVESDTRKAAFLREVSRETGAGVTVHNFRVEDVLPEIDPDVIVSRAMADLNMLVSLAQPSVEKGAIALFLKGRDVAGELTRASIPSNFSVTFTESKIDPESSIVRVRAIQAPFPGG